MTGKQLKEKFCCTDERCAYGRSLLGIFELMHKMGSLLEKLDPDALEMIAAIVTSKEREATVKSIGRMLAGGFNPDKLLMQTLVETLVPFALLESEAQAHAAASAETKAIGEIFFPECKGPIQ
jgi:hypothetical protein